MTNYVINFTDPLTGTGSFVIKPYTSNGPRFPTTTVRPTTSKTVSNSPILLYGKGAPNYGERTDENLLHLLENFAGASEPAVKVKGMLWYRQALYVRDVASIGSPLGATDDWYQWNGSSWSTTTVSEGLLSARPTSTTDATLYFATDTHQLFIYSDDERNIQSWIEREYEVSLTNPNGSPGISEPTMELRLWNGTSWETIQTSAIVAGGGLDTIYLRLDGGNSPTNAINWGAQDLTNIGALGSSTLTIATTSTFSGLATFNASIALGGGVETWTISSADEIDFSHNGTSVFKIYRADGSPLSAPDAGILRVSVPGYESFLSDDNDIPNKKYVDNQAASISGSPIPDNYVIASGSSFTSGTLTLATTGAHIDAPSFDISGFDSDQIPYVSGGSPLGSITVDDGLTTLETTKAPLESPTFTGTVTVPEPVNSTDATTKNYVDTEIASATVEVPNPRTVITAFGGSPNLGGSPLFYIVPSYTVGFNKLMIFADGIKQYASIKGYVDALYSGTKESDTGVNVENGGNYLLADVLDVFVGSPNNTWRLRGDHTTRISAGQQLVITGNSGGGNGTYTVASVNLVSGSPTVTDVTVVEGIGGSPEGASPAAAPDGTAGAIYTAEITVDVVGSPFVLIEIDSTAVDTFGDLITEINSQMLLAGANAKVALYNGDIRVQSSSETVPGPSSIAIIDGVGTEGLFFNAGVLSISGSPYITDFTSFDTTYSTGLTLTYNEVGDLGVPSTTVQETNGVASAWPNGTILEFIVLK